MNRLPRPSAWSNAEAAPAAGCQRRVWIGLLVGLAVLLVVSCHRRAAPPMAELAPGLAYTNHHVPKVPWSIHIVRLDRQRRDLEFHTTHARGTSLGLTTVTDQLKSLPTELGTPVVAVNGDYYQFSGRPYAGDARGLQIANGELLSAPNGGVVFWIDATGEPRGEEVNSQFHAVWADGRTTPFGLNELRPAGKAVLYTPSLGATSTGTSNGWELVLERQGEGPWLPLRVGETCAAAVREVRFEGNTALSSNLLILSIGPDLTNRVPAPHAGSRLGLSLATSPDLKGVRTAIGGGPILVRNGKRLKLNKPEENGTPLSYEYRSMWERHPRTVLGWDSRYFYLVLVDGRQKDLSVGMTLDELTDYMRKEVGCTEVVNLDGGGSATLWCDGTVRNSPCDGKERAVANALIVVRTENGQGTVTVAPGAGPN